ncbi:hypothetical protein [Desulfosporosinus sp. I2]|nr:hypothetical protein [Desulfosporosinus sp. I2]
MTIVSGGEYRRMRTALNDYYRAEDEYRRSRYPQSIPTGEGCRSR